MNFQVETDLERCHQLWDLFSPHKNIFDLWEYRVCFFSKANFKPRFIVGSENNQPVGILPLWFEKEDHFYTFFGGTYPEPNTFLIKDRQNLKIWLDQCPPHTRLYDIAQSETAYFPLAPSETRYALDLSKFHGRFEECIAVFDQKHRKNLRYDLKQFEKNNYTLRFNHLADFEPMVELNQARFKGESDYHDSPLRRGVKKLMETAYSQNRLQLISLLIGNRVEAVEMAVTYKQVYSVLAGGHNLEIENIGKRLIVEHFRLAQVLGAKKIDFLSSDSGWKKRWHMDTEPVYEFKN